MTLSAYAAHLPSLDSVNYTLGLLGIAAILLGWWRGWWESPKRRTQREQNQAVHDAILGKPERRDRSGAIATEGQPGLVALQRADSDRLSKLEEAFELLANINPRITGLETRVTLLEESNVKDVMATVERAATAAASTEMLRMIRDRGTVDGDADEHSELD